MTGLGGLEIGDWGLGIGDWGLRIADWGLGIADCVSALTPHASRLSHQPSRPQAESGKAVLSLLTHRLSRIASHASPLILIQRSRTHQPSHLIYWLIYDKHDKIAGMEKFCSQCGTPLTTKFDGGRERAACPLCDHIVYGRFSLGTGGLLIHDGKVLLIQRGEEPGKGVWTLPGGYVEADETPDEGVVREVWEETGLRTKVMGLFCIRHYAGERRHGIYYVFALELAGTLEELREEGDGSEIEQAGFFSPQELDSLGQIGQISRWAIEQYQSKSTLFSRLPYDMGVNKRYKGVALFGVSEN